MLNVKLFGETMPTNDVEEGAGKGIHFIINGWVLSCQAGWGNYCSQDPMRCNLKLTRNTIRTDCEIAIWNKRNDKMITLDEDTVMGWVSWDMVLDIVEYLRKAKPDYKEATIRRRILELKKEYDSNSEEGK